jgi:hypothetical protein
MTFRKEERGDKLRWVIDIPYQTADGKSHRFRRDAQVQTRVGADSEHRRLLGELSRTGTTRSGAPSELAPRILESGADVVAGRGKAPPITP